MKDTKKLTRRVVVQATTILILIAFIFVIMGYMYLSNSYGYKLDDLVEDIIGNLIGVLAAFLLFDILYNKLTQDAYSKEISQHITKTLMGDPDTLDAFSDEDKKIFLESTMKSIVKDEDTVDMVIGNMDKYFSRLCNSRMRKSFNYSINLSTEFPGRYDNFPGIKENKYFYVQEIFNYDIKYLSEKDKNFSNQEVKIGFSFDKRYLDTGLVGSNRDSEFAQCIFYEKLDITKKAIEYLRGVPEKDLKNIFQDLFSVVLKIDAVQGELDNVKIQYNGIIATYKIDYDYNKREHAVRIIFHMPKLWNSIFEVVLVDPTKDPKITFDYIPERMDVTMYSYLNKEDTTNEGAYEQKNGVYDIAVKDEWIYPKSGILFEVKRK